jgi:hypothetical protein
MPYVFVIFRTTIETITLGVEVKAHISLCCSPYAVVVQILQIVPRMPDLVQQSWPNRVCIWPSCLDGLSASGKLT